MSIASVASRKSPQEIGDCIGDEVEIRLFSGEVVNGWLMELPTAADHESYAVIANTDDFRWVNLEEIASFRTTTSRSAA